MRPRPLACGLFLSGMPQHSGTGLLRRSPFREMTMTFRYPHLQAFLSGYFHQDWPLESASADQVVRTYMDSEDRASVSAALAEIELLLAAVRDNDQLSNIVSKELGSGYDPGSDQGMSVREWLERTKKQLAEGLQSPP